jgi:hypothetical protein
MPLWSVLNVFGIVDTDRRMKSGGIEFPSVSLVLLVRVIGYLSLIALILDTNHWHSHCSP